MKKMILAAMLSVAFVATANAGRKPADVGTGPCDKLASCAKAACIAGVNQYNSDDGNPAMPGPYVRTVKANQKYRITVGCNSGCEDGEYVYNVTTHMEDGQCVATPPASDSTQPSP